MKIFVVFVSSLVLLLVSCDTVENQSQSMETTAKHTVEPIKAALMDQTPPKPVVDDKITEDYLMGKFVPTKHPDFVKIAAAYASTNNMLLRKEAYEAFLKMYAAAKKEGIELRIISATRPFAHQKRIWEAKWKGVRKVDGQDLSKTIPDPAQRALKILEFSSMPGTSRHHWGTDIDLNDLNNVYFAKGKGKKIYDWLSQHAAEYGFCQPYSPKGAERPDGYNEEKWHWSYLPIAKQLTDQYRLRIQNKKIQGFAGAEAAEEIDVVKKYVLGINKECL